MMGENRKPYYVFSVHGALLLTEEKLLCIIVHRNRCHIDI